MLPVAVNQASFGYTMLTMLVGGWLSSLAFIINMLIVSGVIYLVKKHREARASKVIKRDAQDVTR